MTTFKAGETYRTRDGREARVYATDGHGMSSAIHGAYRDPEGWILNSWGADGHLWAGGDDRPLDLMPPAPAEYRECRLVEGAPCYFCEARDGKVPVYKLVKMHGSAEAWRCPNCKSVYIMPAAPAEKLTAEDLIYTRSLIAKGTPMGGVLAPFVEALDASRAETEAVRRERDAALTSRDGWWKQAKAHNRAQKELKALAAEMVEGLDWLLAVIDSAGLLNLSNGVQLGQTAWYVKAYDATEHLRTLGSRARAQGIGGEKEKGNE